MVFYAQGGSREVQGWKGAVQGSQMDPLDGPIASLVEGDTFFRTPLFGVDSPHSLCQWHSRKGGSEKSIAPDQTGYGAIQLVHLGPLNRTFPALYFPGSSLSVENHCFGTCGQSASFRRRYLSKKKCQTSTSDGDGRGGYSRGPGNRGGHGLSRAGDGSPCAARNPLVMPKNAPLRRLRAEGPHAEISDFSPGSLPKFSTPIDLPGGHWA